MVRMNFFARLATDWGLRLILKLIVLLKTVRSSYLPRLAIAYPCHVLYW